MNKILLVFGTRPEAIKMAPLVKALKKEAGFDTKVCVTAQHRKMLDQVLSFFNIVPDFDLNIMKPNQTLSGLWANILTETQIVLNEFKPDLVLVHGDTATSTAVALASFFSGIKIGHVEAGLRTRNKYSPFPEEINRQITSRVADFHFAPTESARENLLKEGVDPDSIYVTGNTIVDALLYSVNLVDKDYSNPEIEHLKSEIDFSYPVILVTGHRHENFGKGLINICNALIDIVKSASEVEIVYPVHLNPNVQEPVNKLLSGITNIHLMPPLSYPSFVWLMNKSKIILTDSGGIQEEAPSLGKPVLVMRNTTERPEAIEAGTAILVGTDRRKIVKESIDLIYNPDKYGKMSRLRNPFGNGKASEEIIKILK